MFLRSLVLLVALGGVAHCQETTIGPVKVKFVGFVDKLKYWDRAKGNTPFLSTRKEYLAVKVRLENTDEKKVIRFEGWSWDGKTKEICAWAVDDLGNQYQCYTFDLGPNEEFVDLVAETTRLDVGKPVFDTIIYEKPIAAAKQLIISLPEASLGLGTDKHEIKIDLPK